MVLIEGGRFSMGSENYDHEKPVHPVELPDFYLAKTPVTVEQYLCFADAAGKHYPEWLEAGNAYHWQTGEHKQYYVQAGQSRQKPDHPIVGVSWDDARAFCRWLSDCSGQTYRLPSEAEWEYAARGGALSKGFPYAGGHKLKEVGWYGANSHQESKPVGLKLPNELGLYDMSGNVWEWCADHWHNSYAGAPDDGSARTEGGDETGRVIRGGSWYDYDSVCRVSYRNWFNSYYRSFYLGFRVARY